MGERVSNQQRILRMLVMLRSLQPNSAITLAELSRHTGLSSETLASELTTLSLCAIDQRNPLTFVPVLVEDDHVIVFGHLPALEKPVRLSVPEISALIAALETAGIPEDDDLLKTLVSAACPGALADDVRRMLKASASSSDALSCTLRRLTLAINQNRVVVLEYQGAKDKLPARRALEPSGLARDRDQWYLHAYCRNADAERTFRVDRMRSVSVTAERFCPRNESFPAIRFDTTGLPKARLRVAKGIQLDEEDWPAIAIVTRMPDGTLLAEVPFANLGWISRKVLSHLGDIEVISPLELRKAVADLAHDALEGQHFDIGDR